MFKLFRWLGSFLSGLTALALVLGCVLLGVYFWVTTSESEIASQFGQIYYLGYIGGTLLAAGAIAGFFVAALYLVVLLLALFKRKRMVKYGGVLAWNLVAFVLWAALAVATFVSVYYSKLPAAFNTEAIPTSEIVTNVFGNQLPNGAAWLVINAGENATMAGWITPLAIFAALAIIFAIIAGHAGTFTRRNYRTEAQVEALKARRA